MNEQFVIEIIKHFPRWNLDKQWLNEEDMLEISVMAIKALEKQIPKKVKVHIAKEEDNRKYHYCPACGRHLMTMTSFCPDCGQKMKWSE